MFKKMSLIFICFVLIVVCNPQNSQAISKKSENSLNFSSFDDGRDEAAQRFSKTYEIRPITNALNILINNNTFRALDYSNAYLNRKRKITHSVGDLLISDGQLLKANEVIKHWASDTTSFSLFEELEAYQIAGEDNQGNVHITGYFIPIIDVRRQKDSIYKYPLYRKPTNWSGRLPSREAIDHQNALDNRGLELCYSANLLDNFLVQVQGSGLVQYANGERELLSYGGENGHRYNSIGKYLVAAGHVPQSEISLKAIRTWAMENPDSLDDLLNRNPSYVFFNKSPKEPSGAAGVPLSDMVSVAVDKRYIPLGSTLLAAVPILDKNNDFIGHEYRILTAQDVGGAIKGQGRMDFFCGIGDVGEKRSGALNHYGKVWLLLPKE